MALEVARSLKEILDDPDVVELMDRSKDAQGAISRATQMLGKDLAGRNPGMFPDGRTDLPLLPVLLDAARREAVLGIKEYELQRPVTRRSDQRVIFHEYRHGPAMNVTSHEKTPSFSIGIMDMETIQRTPDGEIIGYPKNYMVVGDEGELLPSVDNIIWDPETLRYFRDKGLMQNGTVRFAYPVDMQLAMSIYGKPYFVRKIAGRRAKEEAAFHTATKNRIMDMNIVLPEWTEEETKKPDIKKEKPAKRKVTVLQASLEISPFQKEYVYRGEDINGRIVFETPYLPYGIEDLQAVLRHAIRMESRLRYKKGTTLRAAARAVELAFKQYGGVNGPFVPGEERYPAWPVPRWEKELYSPDPGVMNPRNYWNRLKISEHVALFCRLTPVSVDVRNK